ncbi:hypothetical protein ACLRGF_01530 [Mycetocola zhadangensis]|uniref:hypothetical protein n=1 Tax=Mycetocola zhadangensis TaxID=1164595 RepID=UPI003A4E127A
MKVDDTDRKLIEDDDSNLKGSALKNDANFALSLPFSKSPVDSIVRDGAAESRKLSELNLGDVRASESTFTLSMPFAKMTAAGNAADISSDAETARLSELLREDGAEASTDVAERERIAQPTPTIFLAGNKQRQTRSILTVVISIVAVLALVSVGIMLAVKSQEATPAQQAFDAYTSQQLAVAKTDRALTSTFERYQAAKADVDSINVASAAALAAVVGVSDETSRAATDALRLEFVASVTEITVTDPAETPYVAPKVSTTSSLSEIAVGVDEVAAEAARIEGSQLELDAAFTALRTSRTAFTTAFVTFAKTIPATSTEYLSLYPDAGQEWRDAVTTSVNALTTAVGSGLGANEMQTYAAAAFALQDENARVVAEEARRKAEEVDEETRRATPDRPRATPDAPAPNPVDPAPGRDPVDPGPAPEPSPNPNPVDPNPEIPVDPA